MFIESGSLSEHFLAILTGVLLYTEVYRLVVTTIEPYTSPDQTGAGLTVYWEVTWEREFSKGGEVGRNRNYLHRIICLTNGYLGGGTNIIVRK